MKRKSLAQVITASVTEQLVDYLHGNPRARVVVVYKGKKYGISDTIKSPDGLIFMVDEDDKFAKAETIIDDVMDARGLPLYLEIKGKQVPVKAVDAYERGIIIEASVGGKTSVAFKPEIIEMGDAEGLVVGENGDFGITLLVSEDLVDSAEIEINWGPDQYEIVMVDDVMEELKKNTGLKPDKKVQDAIIKFVQERYGIVVAKCKNKKAEEDEVEEPLKNSANLKGDLVEQIQDWVEFDVEKEQIEAILWGLAMVNDSETVTRVINEIAEEDRGEKEEIYSSATSVVAGITTKS